MKKPTRATVVFLEDPKGNICLARKKKAIHHDTGEITFSLGTWNGYGGKEEIDDISIEDTAIRELVQESGVVAYKENLIPCGHVYFFWPDNTTKTSADMEVFFYFLRTWKGSPREGDEMGEPMFFKKNEIPYKEMMSADALLLPKMFDRKAGSYEVFFGIQDEQGRPLCKEL